MFQLPKLPARCCCCWSLRFPHQALGELVSMKICLNGQRLWVTVLAGCARTLRNVRPKRNDTCRLHGLSTLLTMKCSKISKGWHRIWQNDLLSAATAVFQVFSGAFLRLSGGLGPSWQQARITTVSKIWLTRVGESFVILNFKTQFEQHVGRQFLLPSFFWKEESNRVNLFSGTSYDLQKRQGSPLYKLLTVTVSWREHLKPNCGERLNLDLRNGSYYK